jgi:hypothetical protein
MISGMVRVPSAAACASAVSTSLYSGSPSAPGSLQRSSTAIAIALGGQRTPAARRRKRPVQAHLQHADFLAVGRQVLDRLVRRLGTRAHEHDDALGILCTDIVEQPIMAAGELAEAVHRILHDLRKGIVVGVGAFARLEEHIGILRTAAQHRVLGRQGACPVGRDEVGSSMARTVSSSTAAIFATSWEVRKPSKKWITGMRPARLAACAIRAKSCASCGELARAARSRWRDRP